MGDKAMRFFIAVIALLGLLLGVFPGSYLALALGLAAAGFVVCSAGQPELALYAAAFGIPVLSNSLGLGLAIAAAALWGFSRLRTGNYHLEPTGLDIPIAMLIALLVVSTVSSIDPAKSLPDLAISLAGIGLFFVTAYTIRTKAGLYRLVLVLICVAALVSLYGIYQFIMRVPPPESGWVDASRNPFLQTRAFSTFGNPNVLANFLILSGPLALALASACRHAVKKILFFGVFGVLGVCMLLTFSRGGWLGLLVATVLFSLAANRKLLLLMLIIAVVSLAIVPQVDILSARLQNVGKDSSVSYRMVVWTEALYIIRDFWPVGVGLGHRPFMQIYPAYMLDRNKKPFHTHNQYLQLVVETGVLGLIIYGWIIFRNLRQTLHLLREERDRLIVSVSAAVSASLAGLAVMGMTDNILYRPKVILILWVVLGIAAAAGMLQRRLAQGGEGRA
ncbi:MAG: O-antigen ligase family protein [Bacillota bacterium]